MRTNRLFLAMAAALSLASTSVLAVPTQVVHIETPQCDPLFIPTNVDEIGDALLFPSNEALTHSDLGQSPVIPCLATDDSNLPEVLVEIRNASGRVWKEVWYVANPETSITNFDGEANDISDPPVQEAFRIDNAFSDPNGTHHPLISESITSDGIWEIGETWEFVLQDYVNTLGLPPDAITSIGVGDASVPSGTLPPSSGSIIATPVPEPATALLTACCMAGLVAAGRHRRVCSR